MKIYTRKGDQGTTGLIGGSRVSKDDDRINAIGTIDTLGSQIGYLFDLLEFSNDDLYLDQVASLQRIQSLLFLIGALLSDPDGRSKLGSIDVEDVTTLETQIDRMTHKMPPLKNFILPRGHRAVSWAHVVRSTVRMTERTCLHFGESTPQLLPFLNRLSDYFFTLARYLGYCYNITEVTWSSKDITKK